MALVWPVASASAVAAATQEPPPPPRMPGRQPPPPGDSPFAPGQQSAKQLVKMRMAADVTRIAPGEKFHLAFIFDVEPHWHIYWQNAGASGTPTEISIKAPPGFTIGRTLFPRPQIIDSPEGETYGYETQTLLLVEVTAPREAMPQVGFNAKASWLVCKDICKMGSASETLSLPFGSSTLPDGTGQTIDPLVETYKPRLPTPLKGVKAAEAQFDGTTLTLNVPAKQFDGAQFFPHDTPGVEYGEAHAEKSGAFVRVSVPIAIKPQNALGKPLRLAGVVGLGTSQEDPCYEFEIPLDAEGRPTSGIASSR
jgi:thiol:disulfide interchange protein DsbD